MASRMRCSSSSLRLESLSASKKIDRKYQSTTFVLVSGKVITGLILKETDAQVQVIDNPVTPDKFITISKSEIDERAASSVSLMPKGVLNKLLKDEILDLLAYVAGKGDKENPLFSGHDHNHGK